MQDTNDPHHVPADSDWPACLHRTRSAVLNVLVGVGLTIAIGGWILRGRAEAGQPPKPQRLHHALMGGLFVLAITSYLVRFPSRRRAGAADAGRRQAVFYWSHVLSAAIAALAAPMGIVYGWWIDARLAGVIPFWVVPLSMGFLAIPRARELDDFRPTSTNPGAPPP
jgi:hypothetical protein